MTTPDSMRGTSTGSERPRRVKMVILKALTINRIGKVLFTGPVPSGSRLVGRFQLARVDDIKPAEVRCVWQTVPNGR